MSITSPRLSHEPPSIVRLLIERAELLSRHGRRREAEGLYAAAIAADPTPTARIAFAVHLSETNLDRAIEEFEQAFDEARTLGSPCLRAICCQNLAALFGRLQNPARAMQYQQLALAAEMESERFATTATLSPGLLADVAASWASDEDAATLDRLLAGAERASGKEAHPLATIVSHRGVFAARVGQSSEALRHFLRAYRLFRGVADDAGCAQTLLNLGHVLQSRRRFTEAARCFTLSTKLFQQLRQSDRAAQSAAYRREVDCRVAMETANPQWN